MKSRSFPNLIAVVVLLFLLLEANSNCYAQTDSSSDSLVNAEAPTVEATDSLQTIDETVLERTPLKGDSDNIVKWKRSREFSYIHYLDSLLRNQKDIKSDTVSLDGKTGGIKRNHPRNDNSYVNRLLNSAPFKLFFWLLALLFIGFIVYNLLFKNGIFSRRKNKSDTREVEDSEPELIEISKYDSLIGDAENIGNFNLATRYLFLKTLRLLSEKELIHFAADKTNHEYLLEMSSNNYYEEFKSLTHNYEYVWYGKFLIHQNAYQQVKDQYQLFNKKV